MSRLIEAGKILDNLSGMLKNMDDYDAVKKVINDMPTAYDVDAVVKQLDEYITKIVQVSIFVIMQKSNRDSIRLSIVVQQVLITC